MMKFQERYEDYLMHYGVPGMKCGIRRANRALAKADRYHNKAKKKLARQRLKKARLTGDYGEYLFGGYNSDDIGKALDSNAYKLIAKVFENTSDYHPHMTTTVRNTKSNPMGYSKLKTRIKAIQNY